MAASKAQIAEFRAVQGALSKRARAALREALRRLDRADRARLIAYVTSAGVDVLQALGEISAVTGADFYDSLRASNRGLRPYTAVVPGPAPEAQIAASISWALAQPNVVGNLDKVADRLVKLPGRHAIEWSVAADPNRPRFARVPQGATTCRFCAMLASRGAVYLTADTAAGHDYHDFCDCEAVPIFDDALPEGFDPDHYLQIYLDAGGADIDLSGSRDAVIPSAS